MSKILAVSILFLFFIFCSCTQTTTTPIGRIGEIIDLKSDLPQGVTVPDKLDNYEQVIKVDEINMSVRIKWSCFTDSRGKFIKSVEFINEKEAKGFTITAGMNDGTTTNMGTIESIIMAKIGYVRAEKNGTFGYHLRSSAFEIQGDGKFLDFK